MFLEETKNPSGLYALIGTAEDFRALRNVLGVARSASHSFSSTECTVLHEVQNAIYEEIVRR